MVVLSSLYSLLNPEHIFERGHPIQLLLYLFNQFNQESVFILFKQIETLSPKIPNESLKLIENAQKILDLLDKRETFYKNATDEEKEYFQQQLAKQAKKSSDETPEIKETEEKEGETNNNESDNNCLLDAQEFRICDLYLRKACKLSPHCIQCYLKHIHFLFQCNKIATALGIIQKVLNILHDCKKHCKNERETATKVKSKSNHKPKYKSKKQKELAANAMNTQMSEKECNALETLIYFYIGYLYYMRNDIAKFQEYLVKSLDREPKNIGIRCQFVVCLSAKMEYEKAYLFLVETLQEIKVKESTENAIEITAMLKHYQMICNVGCAALRCVFGVDWEIIAEHLETVVTNHPKIGILRYCLSYALHKCAKSEQSVAHYREFEQYMENKKKEILQKKKGKNGDPMDDAMGEFDMKLLKWHPNQTNDTKLYWKIGENMLDCLLVILLIFATFLVSGYRVNFGNDWYDWIVICVVFIVSSVLLSPPLGIFLMVVSLPPLSENVDGRVSGFGYTNFLVKWLCVSMGLLFVYKVIIGGQMPKKGMF